MSSEKVSLIARSIFYIILMFQNGFIYGTIAYFAINYVFDLVCYYAFGLKRFTIGMDALFQKMNCTTCYYVITTKANGLKPLQEQLKKNGNHLAKFRSKIVSFFGNYYFQELKGAELRSKWKQSFIEVDSHIKDEKQLNQYLLKLVPVDFDPNDLQFQIYLIKNYNKDESCFIFKVNHTMVDGVGSLLLATGIQDTIEPQNFPFIRKYSLYDKVMKNLALLLLPYFIVIESIKSKKENNNHIKQFQTANDKLQYSTSNEYQVDQLKKVSRKQKCTINDLIVGVLSQTFKEYYKDEKDFTSHVSVDVVFNVRSTPTKREEMTGGNFNISHIIMAPVTDNLEVAVKECQDKINTFKGSPWQFVGYYYPTFLIQVLPNFSYPFMLSQVVNPILLIATTNLCGPEVPLKFGNSQSKRACFASHRHETYFLFSILSHCGILKMGLSIRGMDLEAERFMAIYDEKIKSLIGKSM